MPAFDASAADVKVPGFVLDRKGIMSFEPDWLDLVRNGASGKATPTQYIRPITNLCIL
jgi:hypothetical protein